MAPSPQASTVDAVNEPLELQWPASPLEIAWGSETGVYRTYPDALAQVRACVAWVRTQGDPSMTLIEFYAQALVDRVRADAFALNGGNAFPATTGLGRVGKTLGPTLVFKCYTAPVREAHNAVAFRRGLGDDALSPATYYAQAFAEKVRAVANAVHNGKPFPSVDITARRRWR